MPKARFLGGYMHEYQQFYMERTNLPMHLIGTMAICALCFNAKDTGRKMTDKVYYWHTGLAASLLMLTVLCPGYVGNPTERILQDQMARDPTEVIRKAVIRMLPRNKLHDDRERKLRIFPGSKHPFGDRLLQTFEMPPREVREMQPRVRRAMIQAQKKAEQQLQSGNDSKKGKKRESKEEEDTAA